MSLRTSALRGVVFALAFLGTILVTTAGVAYAANGGLFGDLLNKILVKSWDDTTNDGTVKNAQKLDGQDANSYQRTGVNQTCGSNMCVYGFNAMGDVMCR